MNRKKIILCTIILGTILFAGHAKDKQVVLDENNLIQESETTENVRSINLSDGNWKMVWLTEQESMYSWDELVTFEPNQNYYVWDFTIDGDSVTLTSGYELWRGTLKGDIAKFKKKNPWVKKCIKGKEFNNPSGDYPQEKVEKTSWLLKEKMLPGLEKELPEDSTHIIKTNEARTKFIYDYNNDWRGEDGKPFDGKVILYFAKIE